MGKPPKQPKKTKKRFYRYQYAVKFICTANAPGTSQTDDRFPPGSYQTLVNIHNPWEKDVGLRKKLATAGVISEFLKTKLKYDEVEIVTCKDIAKFEIVTVHGFEGFLVIESTRRLDVSAVYTAAGKDGFVVSIDVENVKGRKI